MLLRMLPLLMLLFFLTAFAIEEPPEAKLTGESNIADDDVLELDLLEVTGERLSLKQETRLRFIRRALDEPRSFLKKDWDKMLCWLEAPVGTRLRYVLCARNGDLEAVRPGGVAGVAGYGRHHFWRSVTADNSATLRTILGFLSDSEYFDQDFVSIALAGDQPPQDVPGEKELHQFAKAWIETEKLAISGQPEDQLIAAITAEGLTLRRYNRLVELTESFQSIRGKVTELVAEQQSLDSQVGLKSVEK